MIEYTQEQIEAFKTAPPARIFGLFVSLFPPEFGPKIDVMLARGVKPETIFELPSAAGIPPVIKEVTIKALYWRKRQLLLTAPRN